MIRSEIIFLLSLKFIAGFVSQSQDIHGKSLTGI